VNKILYMY